MVKSGKTKGTGFASGVLLLSLSTLLVKLVGLLYKIPLLSYLGSVGMGYFYSAYELYALFCVIATAGLPVALSVLISAALARGDEAEVERIYRSAMRIFFWIGIVGSASMVLLADTFCRLLQSDGARASMIAIAPTVLFICLSSGYRGYFQGHGRMAPTAISQLLEAVGKLALGLWFASGAHAAGMEAARVAAAAGWGLTLSTALSTLYLALRKGRGTARVACEAAAGGTVRRSLLRLAIPMTLGASVVSLTKMIDVTMILRRLQAIGYSETEANELYGSYTALALSVFALIPSLISSIALPLTPILSGAIERGDLSRQRLMTKTAYRLTALFAVPASLGVTVLSEPILSLLFGNEPKAVQQAAPLLSALGVSILLSCMITTTSSVLHAYRAVRLPVYSMLAGAAVKILSAYLLIGHPQIGIVGAPFSTFLCDLTVVMMNLLFVFRLCRVEGLSGVLFRPLVAAVAAVGVAAVVFWAVEPSLGSGPSVLLALGLCVLIYLPMAFLTGAVDREELSAIPMGGRLRGIAVRFRLLR